MASEEVESFSDERKKYVALGVFLEHAANRRRKWQSSTREQMLQCVEDLLDEAGERQREEVLRTAKSSLESMEV